MDKIKDMDKDMNDRVLSIRKHFNLSQEKFGKSIGVSGSAISYIESYERPVSDRLIVSISLAYNVNETWLRTGTGKMFNECDNELEYYLGQISADSDEFKRSLIKSICKLTPEEWETLKKVVTETYIDSKEG